MHTPLKRLGLLTGILCTVATAYAYDFEANGIFYDILSQENKTAAATYASRTAAEQELYATGELTIPETVSHDDETYTVTAIGGYAFRYCTGLTTVHLPATLTDIGSYAFAGCSGLTQFEIPASLSVMGNYAVAGCSALKSISVDEENETFASQDGVLYSKDMTELIAAGGAITGEFTVPTTVTAIGNDAFYACSGLTSVVIPAPVASIGSEAFLRCENLVSATLPETLTSIGAHAFNGCAALEAAVIPEAVETIGTCAYYNCTSITSVHIPASVTEIGATPFYGCAALASLSVAPENTAYCAADNILFNKDMTELIFCVCRKEGEVIIPETVTTIAGSAFAGCDSITSVTIPESTNTIGTFAFVNCTALEEIHSLSATPPKCTAIFLVTTVFSDSTLKDAILYVPEGSKSAYMSATPWRSFLHIEETVSPGEEPGSSAITTTSAEESPEVYVGNGTIEINGFVGNALLYSSDGRLIYNGNASSITLPAPGLYILRIADKIVKILF